MDFKVMLTTFGIIFLAELGDKTQIATFCFAAESESRLAVFVGSASALILTSLLAVVFGSVVNRLVPWSYVRIGAGALFVFLGVWILLFPGGSRVGATQRKQPKALPTSQFMVPLHVCVFRPIPATHSD